MTYISQILSPGNVVTAESPQSLRNKTFSFDTNTPVGFQRELVSGVSLKTINGNSLLGSGNINISGSGTGGISYSTYTSNVTASNQQGIVANTSAGSFTVTMPSNPQPGYYVSIVDGDNWQNNPLQVNANGSTFEGLEPLINLDIAGAAVDFIYNGNSWQVYAALGGVASATPSGFYFTKVTGPTTIGNRQGIIADTSAGSFAVTLPASPVVGSQCVICDGNNWGAHSLTVARNGSTIEGLPEDLVLDIQGTSVTLIYDGATWQVYAQIGSANVSELVTETILGTRLDQFAQQVVDYKIAAALEATASGYIITKPVVTGETSTTSGSTISLTAAATSLSTSATIASFEWTLPDTSTQLVSATNNQGVLNFTATGTSGSTLTLSVQAINSAGARSAATQHQITLL